MRPSPQALVGRVARTLLVALVSIVAGTHALPAAAQATATTTGPQPGIFGFAEIALEGNGPSRQWLRMLELYAVERAEAKAGCIGGHCHVTAWLAFLDGLRGMPLAEQLNAVNDRINAAPYVEDLTNYGVADYWATPGKFFHRYGDCEDFAIVKFLSLRELGVPAESLRVVIVGDQTTGLGHAILAVYTGQDIMILDSKVRAVVPAANIAWYLPLVSITQGGWWLHAPAIAGGIR